jgi:hypothetical protein
MPETSFFSPEKMALAQQEAQAFRETQRGEGFLSSVGVKADQLFSVLGNLPNRIAFGEDFEQIRGQSSQLPFFIQHEQARRPDTFGETLGQGIGASIVSAPLAGAAALPFAATAAPVAVNALAGATAGGIEGAALPELFGAKTPLGGAAAGAIGGGVFGAALPIGLRPLSKYIPGVNKIVPDVTLREAFDASMRSAALGEGAELATQLFPKSDVIDMFFGMHAAAVENSTIRAGLKGMRLRSLGEALDSQARGITGDLPFRRLQGDPQFAADTALRKALKAAGLRKSQQDLFMNMLTTHERSALSLTMDPMAQRFEPGGMPLSDAVARIAERIPNPAKLLRMQKHLATALADDHILTKAAKEFGIRRASPEDLGLATRQAEKMIDDIVQEEPMMGLMLPEIFEGTTPGQAQRMTRGLANAVSEKASAVGDVIANPIKKGIPTLNAFLKNLRLGAMLTSPTAPMKNITFNSLNLGLNTFGRAFAGAGDVARAGIVGGPRRIFSGEAVAMFKGLFTALQDDLGHYAQTSRHLREAIMNDGIPLVNIGSKLLKKQDEWFFRRAFSAEMHAEAFRSGKRAGLSDFKALEGTGKWIKNATENFLTSKGYKKAVKTATKAAKEKAIEDNKWITREAARIIRQSGDEPISLIESRLAAERAIFVAREGRHLDDLLNKADEWDTAAHGAIGVISPFRRTPTNELRESVRAMGGDMLGLAYKRLKQDVASGVPEEVARTRLTRDMGKGALGAGIVSALVYMAKEKLFEIVNDEGKQRSQIDTERAQGIPRKAVIVGEHVIPLHVMGGIGRALAIADTIAHFSEDTPEGEEMRTRGIMELTRQIANILEDDLMSDDFVGFLDAMDSAEGSQRYMERFGASFIPGVIRQGRKEGTPITRPGEEPRGFFANIEAGARNEALRKGDPIIGLFGGVATETGGLSKVFGASKKDDLIAQTAEELQSLGLYKEAPNTVVTGVEWVGSEKFDFAKAKGQLQLRAIRQIMDHPRYQGLSVEAKSKLINSAYGKAGRLANSRARAGKRVGIPITGRFILSGRSGP